MPDANLDRGNRDRGTDKIPFVQGQIEGSRTPAELSIRSPLEWEWFANCQEFDQAFLRRQFLQNRADEEIATEAELQELEQLKAELSAAVTLMVQKSLEEIRLSELAFIEDRSNMDSDIQLLRRGMEEMFFERREGVGALYVDTITKSLEGGALIAETDEVRGIVLEFQNLVDLARGLEDLKTEQQTFFWKAVETELLRRVDTFKEVLSRRFDQYIGALRTHIDAFQASERLCSRTRQEMLEEYLDWIEDKEILREKFLTRPFLDAIENLKSIGIRFPENRLRGGTRIDRKPYLQPPAGRMESYADLSVISPDKWWWFDNCESYDQALLRLKTLQNKAQAGTVTESELQELEQLDAGLSESISVMVQGSRNEVDRSELAYIARLNHMDSQVRLLSRGMETMFFERRNGEGALLFDTLLNSVGAQALAVGNKPLRGLVKEIQALTDFFRGIQELEEESRKFFWESLKEELNRDVDTFKAILKKRFSQYVEAVQNYIDEFAKGNITCAGTRQGILGEFAQWQRDEEFYTEKFLTRPFRVTIEMLKTSGIQFPGDKLRFE